MSNRTFVQLLLSITAAAFLTSPLTAQTHLASPLLFSGNTTVIAPPTSETEYAFGPREFGALYRDPDCTIDGIIATGNANPPTFKVLTLVEGFQDRLHKLAGLTTKGDVWPDGCKNPDPNNPGFIGADAGEASNKTYVVATIDASNTNVVDIYNVVISSVAKQSIKKVQTLTVGSDPYSIATADINGDGKPDLVIGLEGSGYPTVVDGGYAVAINNGNGTFGAPSIVKLSNRGMLWLSLVDVNHDGKLDLVAVELPETSTGSYSVGVYLGNGKGSFTAKANYPVSGQFPTMLVADLNGDGHPDIILGTGQVLLGNGDGTFKAGKSLPFPAQIVASLVAGDFNHDGKMDLAVATTSDFVGVFLGNGDGTVRAPTWYSGVYQGEVISTGDIDGDGNLDLVLGPQSGQAFSPTPNNMGGTGGLAVLLGNGDGTFRGAQAYNTGTFSEAFGFAVADFTGDGKQDIVTGTSLLTGNGKGQFTVTLGTPFPGLAAPATVIRAADFNNDKKQDAIVTTTDSSGNPSTAYVFLGKGGGKFGSGLALAVKDVLDVNVADFNGDKIRDLAVLSYTPGSGISVHVLLGKGNGTFGSPIAVTLPSEASKSTGGRIFSADLRNDNKLDLIVLDAGTPFEKTSSGGTYVLLGNGKGSFTLKATLTEVANPYDAAIADFNKDGKLDLVLSTTNFNGPLNTPPMIFLGHGDGTFGSGSKLSTVSFIPLHLAAADFNGDGKADLLIGSCCGLATTSILFGNGNGTFQSEQIMQVAESPSGIQVADLNGDGRPDIVESAGNASGMLTTLINEYGVVSPTDSDPEP
ncbi:MAG: VCBS repeat-containing protein [Acidobacteriaceae bacterium]|nr:VCBS repeat-containing protein [Acidobacteriaceae bacterium]MBV9780903.1 VCBS repeat-containing protein [Acidobacteriaceae bacterium]